MILKEHIDAENNNSGILSKLGIGEADRMGVMMGQKQNLMVCSVLTIIAFAVLISMGW